MEWLYIVLIVLVVAFGIGVLVYNRRKATGDAAPTRTADRVDRPPPRSGPAAAPTIDRPSTGPPAGTGEAEVLEPELLEPEVEAPRHSPRPAGEVSVGALGAFTGIRGRGGITDETWDDLEEALIRADVGVSVTDGLLESSASTSTPRRSPRADELLDALPRRDEGAPRRCRSESALRAGRPRRPNVWMFVGVNGVGKTTTIGKLAASSARTAHRAAGRRATRSAPRPPSSSARGPSGPRPSWCGAARAATRARSSSTPSSGPRRRGIDLVLADTAGRLHTKSNLMEELRKVRRVAEKGAGRVTEVLLVIDATTGQNGLAQAKEFGEATRSPVSCSPSSTARRRAAIVFAVETQLGLPVKLVGVGETIADLRPFDPDEFVDALFDSTN